MSCPTIESSFPGLVVTVDYTAILPSTQQGLLNRLLLAYIPNGCRYSPVLRALHVLEQQ
jgi:hypothetical protein